MKNYNDMLDISKAKLPQKYVSFVSLRRDLHPVVPNMQTKKRKLEATIDLVKMTNHGPLTHRQALLRKRFKCNEINPDYISKSQKLSNQTAV